MAGTLPTTRPRAEASHIIADARSRAESDATQHYVIDGFILSPNVELTGVQTQDDGFRFSDHNPVLLNIRLK